jgi:hypothetical protein
MRRFTQPDRDGKVRLVDGPPQSVDELLTPIDRAKITAHRALRRIVRAELRAADIAHRLDRIERQQAERRDRRWTWGGRR